MRKTIVSGAIALAALGTGALGVAAESVSGFETDVSPPERHWHFQGPFGTYDRAAAQRGYHVYAEVCSACHSLELLA
jgi:cytochrome c1